MRNTLRVFTAIFLALLAVCMAAAGIFLYRHFSPTREKADLDKYFGVSGDNAAALYLNFERQDTGALWKDGTMYLPLDYVNENLNKRYYFDKDQQILIYALPTEIEKRGAEDTLESGEPAWILEGDTVYLSLAEVTAHTDVFTEVFTDDGHPRIFLLNLRDSYTQGTVKKDAAVRLRGGVKSRILTTAAKGDQVVVLETLDHWSKAMTKDGFIGYMPTKRIGNLVDTVREDSFDEPEYTSIKHDGKITMVWHQVTVQAANAGLDTLLGETKDVNVVSPTWFGLNDNEGHYTSLASRDYVAKAHAAGMQVWPLVDNFGHDFSANVDPVKLFSSTKARETLIANLMKEADTYGFDGFNLDIENLKQEAGVHYVEFIREMSVSCRNQGLVLSVDDYVPESYNSYYDISEQGAVADYVVIMGYDEHYAGGDAGSVASIGYTRNGIATTLSQVPKEKVIWGVPFYTRLWTVDGDKTSSKAMGIADAKQWISQNGVSMAWDDETGQYYGERQNGSATEMMWQEEEKSLALKMKEVRDNDLAGVSAWKLGMEEAADWGALSWDSQPQ